MRSAAAPSSMTACLLGVLLVAAPTAPSLAGVLDETPVVYELLEGSRITDGCLDCERPDIQHPLTGTFALGRVDSPLDFDTHAMTEVDLRAPADEYVVTGTGTYRIHTRDGNQDMVLEVDVGGAKGVTLASGSVPVGVSWPVLDITVTEDGSRDPLHVFTIRIVAAPRPKEVVQYELVEGSTVTIDCFVCELANPTQPIEGTFTLGKLSDDNGIHFATYRVGDLSFRNGDGSIEGTGVGLYSVGGDIALLQSLELMASLTGDEPVLLSSGEVPVTSPLPTIDVVTRRSRPPGPGGPIFLQSLHVVARPVSEPGTPFRRGDANADGSTNISDPVFILLWKFSSGQTPPCLDAADTNDDESHDITDPIFLLLYLFQSGSTPPSPGPETCGGSPTPSASCAAYPSC